MKYFVNNYIVYDLLMRNYTSLQLFRFLFFTCIWIYSRVLRRRININPYLKEFWMNDAFSDLNLSNNKMSPRQPNEGDGGVNAGVRLVNIIFFKSDFMIWKIYKYWIEFFLTFYLFPFHSFELRLSFSLLNPHVYRVLQRASKRDSKLSENLIHITYLVFICKINYNGYKVLLLLNILYTPTHFII